VVEGLTVNAVSALTLGEPRVIDVPGKEALQRIAWAAASGGAHGRRRGAAYGRFAAWYIAALLGDLTWPADAGELGARIDSLRWSLWDEGGPEEGWILRVAIESPADGWSAAIAATDLLEEEDAATDA
jgi:hypothetical protein